MPDEDQLYEPWPPYSPRRIIETVPADPILGDPEMSNQMEGKLIEQIKPAAVSQALDLM